MKPKILLFSLLGVLTLTGCSLGGNDPSGGESEHEQEQQNLRETILNALSAQLLSDKQSGCYNYRLDKPDTDSYLEVAAFGRDNKKFISAVKMGSESLVPKEDEYFKQSLTDTSTCYGINDNGGLFIDINDGVVSEEQYTSAKEDLFPNFIFSKIEEIKNIKTDNNGDVYHFSTETITFSIITADNNKKTALFYTDEDCSLSYNFTDVSVFKSSVPSFEGNPYYATAEAMLEHSYYNSSVLDKVTISEDALAEYNCFKENISFIANKDNFFRVNATNTFSKYHDGYLFDSVYVYREIDGKYYKYIKNGEDSFYRITIDETEYENSCKGIFVEKWIKLLTQGNTVKYNFQSGMGSIEVDGRIYDVLSYQDSLRVCDYEDNFTVIEFSIFNNISCKFDLPQNFADLSVKTFVEDISNRKKAYILINKQNNRKQIEVYGDAIHTIENNGYYKVGDYYCVKNNDKVLYVNSSCVNEDYPLDFVIDVTGYDNFYNLDYEILLDADNYVEENGKFYFVNKPEFNFASKYGNEFANEKIEAELNVEKMSLMLGDELIKIESRDGYSEDFSFLGEKCKNVPVANYDVKSILQAVQNVFNRKTYTISCSFETNSDNYVSALPYTDYDMYESDEAMYVGSDDRYVKFDKIKNEYKFYSLDNEKYYIEVGAYNPPFVSLDEIFATFMNFDLRPETLNFDPFGFYFVVENFPGYSGECRIHFGYDFANTKSRINLSALDSGSSKNPIFSDFDLDYITFVEGNTFNTKESAISLAEEKAPIKDSYAKYLDLKNASFTCRENFSQPVQIYPNGFIDTSKGNIYVEKDADNFDKYALNKTPGSFGYKVETIAKSSIENDSLIEPYYLDALENLMNNPIRVYFSDVVDGERVSIYGLYRPNDDLYINVKADIYVDLEKVELEFKGRDNNYGYINRKYTISDIGNETLVAPDLDAFDLFLTEFEVLGNFRYDVNATVNANVPGFGGNPGFSGSISNVSFAEIDKANSKFHKETSQTGTGDYASQVGYQEIWGAYNGTKYEGYVRNLKGDTPQACVVLTSQAERILNLEDEAMMQVILNKDNFVIDGENNKLYHLKAPVQINYNGTIMFINKCDLDFTTSECLSVSASGSDESGFITYTAAYEFSQLGLADPSYH